MTLKKHYWDKNIEACLTCMYIDEYALNVEDDGKVPHGYDGTSVCCIWDENEEETENNRLFISPLWKACPKYKRCTEEQANYLKIYCSKEGDLIPNPYDISKIYVLDYEK